jgi:hypothetical protein
VQSALGGPASSLNAYPLANTDIANSSVTVNAGNQLTGGGSVNLGGSITVNLDEGAGSGLNADTVDGDQASDLVHVAGDTMSGTLTVNNRLTVTNSQLVNFGTNNDDLAVRGSGSPRVELQIKDSDGRGLFYDKTNSQQILSAKEGGNVDIPSGQLSEQGNRVATRTWTNNNADVPNADYADDADTLDDEHASAFSDAGHSHSESDLDYSNYPLSLPVTKYANGLSGEEIYRIELQSGESLNVQRLEIEPKGGGSLAGLEVDVYDATAGSVLASTTDVQTGSPIALSGSGNTILVRVTNSTGSSQNASIGGELHLV